MQLKNEPLKTMHNLFLLRKINPQINEFIQKLSTHKNLYKCDEFILASFVRLRKGTKKYKPFSLVSSCSLGA